MRDKWTDVNNEDIDIILSCLRHEITNCSALAYDYPEYKSKHTDKINKLIELQIKLEQIRRSAFERN